MQQYPEYNQNNQSPIPAPTNQPAPTQHAPIPTAQAKQPAQPQPQQVKKPAANQTNKQPAQQPPQQQQAPAQPFMLSPAANEKIQKAFEQIRTKYPLFAFYLIPCYFLFSIYTLPQLSQE